LRRSAGSVSTPASSESHCGGRCPAAVDRCSVRLRPVPHRDARPPDGALRLVQPSALVLHERMPGHSGGEVFAETERLILRRFTTDDVDNLVELDSDSEVMLRINGGRPTSREDIETDFLPAFLSYYQRFEAYGFWAVIERSTDDFLGWIHFRPHPTLRRPIRNWATGSRSRPGARDTPQKDRRR